MTEPRVARASAGGELKISEARAVLPAAPPTLAYKHAIYARNGEEERAYMGGKEKAHEWCIRAGSIDLTVSRRAEERITVFIGNLCARVYDGFSFSLALATCVRVRERDVCEHV